MRAEADLCDEIVEKYDQRRMGFSFLSQNMIRIWI